MTADSLVKLAELPSSDEIKAVLGEVKQSSGLTGKHLMTPLRHALTGCKVRWSFSRVFLHAAVELN